MLQIFYILKNALEIPSFDPMQLLYMSIRAIIIYIVGVLMARYNKKLIGIRTPFNFILFITLGSIFTNAIVDAKVFLPIVGSMFLLITINTCMKMLSFRFPWIEKLSKGPSVELITNGKIDWNVMKSHSITKQELLNELANQMHTYDIDKVETAILASDGSLNFIFKQR